MELDVHLTKDNRLAVIHDHHLGALCGYDGIVEDMTLEELKGSGTQYRTDHTHFERC